MLIAQTDSTMISNLKLVSLAKEKKEMRDSINTLIDINTTQEYIIESYKNTTKIDSATIFLLKKNNELYSKYYIKQHWYNSPTIKFLEGMLFTFASVWIATKI